MNIYESPTPRTDEAMDRIMHRGQGLYEGGIVLLCRQLERELETCRDAPMANCLASDTLRREIRELRERLDSCLPQRDESR